ncbi:MAG: LysR family transcriptional regulator [Clostridiales bacterium]|nr:LysR family transcriptional regulator [Clostridiales bacterium]
MLIDSVQVECFLCAAKYLNFSKAADYLYISQPVLSRRILRLEQELGVELFDRSGRSLELTENGKKFQKFFERVSGEFNVLIEDINSAESVTKRQLRIGVCEGIDLSKYIRVILSGFAEINPNIEIVFDSGPVESLLENFKRGHYDIVIMLKVTIENYLKSGIVSKIKIFDLLHVHKCVIYSTNNPLYGKENLRLEDFADQNMYCLKKEHVPQKVLSQGELLENHNISPKIKFLSSMDSIYMALQIGAGFSIFDNHERILNSNDIEHFDLEETQEISMVVSDEMSKNVTEFVNYCLSLKL